MEGDSHEHIEKRKGQIGSMDHDDSTIFQSSWIRHSSTMVDRDDWKYLARQFRYVLYGGTILWTLYAISHIIS